MHISQSPSMNKRKFHSAVQPYLLMLFFTSLCLLFPQQAVANVQISPAVIEANLEEGGSGIGTYLIKNSFPHAIEMTVEAQDWMDKLLGIPDPDPVDTWLSLSQSSFTIEAGASHKVEFTVQAPSPFNREKVAQVFFAFERQPGLIQRMGVILYLTPVKGMKLKASLKEIEWTFDPTSKMLSLTGRIENQGNIHIRPQGTISIQKKKSQEPPVVYKIENLPGIYPDNHFDWKPKWPLLHLTAGKYKAEISLDYGHTYKLSKKELHSRFNFKLTDGSKA